MSELNRREFLLTGLAAAGAVQERRGLLAGDSPFRRLPLRLTSDAVSPGTGIVLWDSHEKVATDAIQLEYSYLRYDDVIVGRDRYDWSSVEQKLDAVAGRRHQAVLRFHDTYPGRKTTVPAYLKELDDYEETHARSEGKPTSFPDWSHPEWRKCVLSFFEQFSRRYDRDPRLAFLQVGFGLWAEYHIYDGPFILGKTFPSMQFQREFLVHLSTVLRETPWMISVDAASSEISPLMTEPDLLSLDFGTFDDSFLCRQHHEENEKNWNSLGRDRWKRAPAGGEFSYYTPRDQRAALSAEGPHGESFERAAARFHISFLIGSDQPRFQSFTRIREAGRACGYRFQITGYETDGRQTRVTVSNIGIAPCYFDAFVSIAGVQGETSLKHLLPGQERVCLVDGPAGEGAPTIVARRLVAGQSIPVIADVGDTATN